MLNIHKSKPQCSNCPDTSVINSMAGKNNCSYQYFLERLLDRCIIRVVLKITSTYLVSCRLCTVYISHGFFTVTELLYTWGSVLVWPALNWINTYQAAFVVYKTRVQKHCLTDSLHCPFQRWNPTDRILDPICKTVKLINCIWVPVALYQYFQIIAVGGKREGGGERYIQIYIWRWPLQSCLGRPSSLVEN